MKLQIFILFAFCLLGIYAAAPKPAAVSSKSPVVTTASAVPDLCQYIPQQACNLLRTCVVKDKKCVFKYPLPNSNQNKESKPKEINPKDPKDVKPQVGGFDPCVLLPVFFCELSSNNVCYIDKHGHCASRIPIPGAGH